MWRHRVCRAVPTEGVSGAVQGHRVSERGYPAFAPKAMGRCVGRCSSRMNARARGGGRRTPRLVACTVSALLPLVGSHNADCTPSAALSTGSCARAQNVETEDEMPQSTTGNAHAQQRRHAPTCADACVHT